MITAWVGRPRGGVHPRHWTERARDRYPATVALGQAGLFPAVAFGVLGAISGPGLAGLSQRSLAGVLAVVSMLTAQVLLYIQIQRIGRFPVRDVLVAQFADLLVRRLPLVLMAVLFFTAPTGPLAPWVVVVGWALIAAATLGGGVQVARLIGLARPGSGVLALPDVVVVPGILVNAYAFQALNRIVFTSAAVERLTDDEQVQILAHERGHLSESPHIRWARLAVLPYLLLVGALAPLVAYIGMEGVAVALALALIPLLFVRRMAHAMENRADHEAHAHDAGYANALEAVYRLNGMPMVLQSATHPSLYDRLAGMDAQPAYPRPDPPPNRRTWVVALGLPMVVVAGLLARTPGPPESIEDLPASLALGASPHWSLIVLANSVRIHDPAAARPLFRAAAVLQPSNAQGFVGVAWTAAMLGDNAEASRALAHLDTLEPRNDPWATVLVEQTRDQMGH